MIDMTFLYRNKNEVWN